MNSSVRPFSLVHLDRVRFIWARTNTARMFKGIWQLFTLELSTKAKIGAKSVDCWHVQFSLLHWRKIIISIPVVTTVQICISKLLIGSFLIESRLSSSLSVFHSLHNYLSHFSYDNTTVQHNRCLLSVLPETHCVSLASCSRPSDGSSEKLPTLLHSYTAGQYLLWTSSF